MPYDPDDLPEVRRRTVAMDSDNDILMEEVSVLRSTELNGSAEPPATVNPAAIFGLAHAPTTVTKDPGPELGSLGSMAMEQSSSPEVTFAIPTGSHAVNDPYQSATPDSESDEGSDDDMEIVTAPPQSTVQVLIPPHWKAALPYSTLQTGIVYDARMRMHMEPPTMLDESDVHPEDPRRIKEIFDEIGRAGLLGPPDEQHSNTFQLGNIEAREATFEELVKVHTPEHIAWVKSLQDCDDDTLFKLSQYGDSIYVHQLTWLAATLSAGGAIEACKAVMSGQFRNAIAVIRPPGHHAEHHKAGGFCFFNNVAVAARTCQEEFGEKCRKILILDWDVHHGNGVQQAFEDDPNVLYISIHVHQDGRFYPSGDYGDHLHCGIGAGLGKNVNIPWPQTAMGDADYIFAFQQIVMPIAMEFSPDFVIVSAGFDAAAGDELGGCYVTPAGYAHMTHMLMSLAQGKIAVCLEGGYNLRSIAKSSLAVTRTLMGEPPDRITALVPTMSAVRTVLMVKRQQSQFWRCMYPKDHTIKGELKGERLHDVIRTWQSQKLYEDHRMASLFIMRDKMSKSFENQVLATANYTEARPLVVIFHDPPEVLGVPDPRTNRLELHNTWLTDVTRTYIDWIVKQGFACIDVNIPKHVTEEIDEGGYVESDNREARVEATKQLATYLWDNYIEIGEATHIFLIGIGDAYTGIIDLLGSHDSCVDSVTMAISFVADSALQAVRRPTDDYVAGWYYQHSRVFVAGDHLVWDPERAKKPKKRYGHLVESPKITLNEMMVHHRQDVFDLLNDETEAWRTEQVAEQVAKLKKARIEEQKRRLVEEDEKVKRETARRSAEIKSQTKSPDLSMESRPLPSNSLNMTVRSPVKGGPPVGFFSTGPPRTGTPSSSTARSVPPRSPNPGNAGKRDRGKLGKLRYKFPEDAILHRKLLKAGWRDYDKLEDDKENQKELPY